MPSGASSVAGLRPQPVLNPREISNNPATKQRLAKTKDLRQPDRQETLLSMTTDPRFNSSRRGFLLQSAAASLYLSPIIAAQPAFANSDDDLPDRALPELRPSESLTNFAFTEVGSSKIHNISDFNGKAVLINLWATWCGPCVVEMPALNRLAVDLAPEGLVVLAISLDKGGDDRVTTFLKKRNLNALKPYMDGKAEVIRALKPRGIPLSVLLDATGQVVAKGEGAFNWDGEVTRRSIRRFLPPQKPSAV